MRVMLRKKEIRLKREGGRLRVVEGSVVKVELMVCRRLEHESGSGLLALVAGTFEPMQLFVRACLDFLDLATVLEVFASFVVVGEMRPVCPLV